MLNAIESRRSLCALFWNSSELHIGLSGTMGALYVKQLAEKTHRGLRGRVESGRSGGGNSYGYDVVRKAGEGGQME